MPDVYEEFAELFMGTLACEMSGLVAAAQAALKPGQKLPIGYPIGAVAPGTTVH